MAHTNYDKQYLHRHVCVLCSSDSPVLRACEPVKALQSSQQFETGLCMRLREVAEVECSWMACASLQQCIDGLSMLMQADCTYGLRCKLHE